MATTAGSHTLPEPKADVLLDARARAADRWVFVGMAVWFIAVVLAGFIPDSIEKIELVRSGQRAPFPPILHAHAVLMGSFLLLLLAQAWLMATGRRTDHMRLGMVAFALVPILMAVGSVLAPTMYHLTWDAWQSAPPEGKARLQAVLSRAENVVLLQIRSGVLFLLFIGIALLARTRDSGLHKRMMFLGTAIPLAAGINRIDWLPSTMPNSPFTVDIYICAALSPMFIWDVVRNRRVHHAYWIWLAVFLTSSIVVNGLWNTPSWHVTARQLMGV